MNRHAAVSRVTLDALAFTCVGQHKNINAFDLMNIDHAKLAELSEARSREQTQEGNPVGCLATCITGIGQSLVSVQRRREQRGQFGISPRSPLVRRHGLDVQAAPRLLGYPFKGFMSEFQEGLDVRQPVTRGLCRVAGLAQPCSVRVADLS